MNTITAYTVVRRFKDATGEDFTLDGYGGHYGLYAIPDMAQDRIDELTEHGAFQDYDYRIVEVTVTVEAKA